MIVITHNQWSKQNRKKNCPHKAHIYGPQSNSVPLPYVTLILNNSYLSEIQLTTFIHLQTDFRACHSNVHGTNGLLLPYNLNPSFAIDQNKERRSQYQIISTIELIAIHFNGEFNLIFVYSLVNIEQWPSNSERLLINAFTCYNISHIECTNICTMCTYWHYSDPIVCILWSAKEENTEECRQNNDTNRNVYNKDEQ